MRMRLFEVMQAALGTFRYGPSVSCQADGLYLDESLANNRARSAIQMLREAHARPCSALLWHIGQEGLCGVLCE